MASAKVTQALRDALNELEAERARIEATIGNLRRVLADMGGGVRRGRPPGKVAAKPVAKTVVKPARNAARRRRGWSADSRNAAAARMKAYWAAKRKAAA